MPTAGAGKRREQAMVLIKHANSKQVIEKLLGSLDVRINGGRPWDIQVDNPDFFNRVLGGGSLALGESYMDGWWQCQAIDQLFDRILTAKLDKQVKKEKHICGCFEGKGHQCPKQIKGLYYRKTALRHGQPPFQRHARQTHELFLRLLGKGDHPGRGPGGQAGFNLPETDAGTGYDRTGHRMRLGRVCQMGRRKI